MPLSMVVPIKFRVSRSSVKYTTLCGFFSEIKALPQPTDRTKLTPLHGIEGIPEVASLSLLLSGMNNKSPALQLP